MKRRDKRGYALVLVLLFMVLMLSLASVAYREVASMLRVESVHATAIHRDSGSVQALAAALALMQTGTPRTTPYVAGVSVTTSTGTGRYTITMTSAAVGEWTVHVEPTPDDQFPSPLPSTF